jgi:hypothetical protein
MPASVPPKAKSHEPQKTKGSKTRTFTAKSKKHGGKKWVYRRGKDGKPIPLHEAGKKPKAKGKSADKPPVEDTRPYGDYTSDVNKLADAEFAPAERQLQADEGIATRHASDLQTVYDRFRAQLAGQAQAAQAAQAQVAQQVAAQTAGTVGALGHAVGQGAAEQAATDKAVGTDYSGEVAKIGAAGAAGANAVAAPAAANVAAVGAADSGLMTQLQAIMDTERAKETAQANQAVLDIRGQRADLAQKKTARKSERYDELQARDSEAQQQAVENELAAQTLLAGDEKSKRDYRTKLLEIQANTRAGREKNKTALEIAAGNNASDERQNEDDNATSRANNRNTNATSAANSRRAARSRENAARISASGKGKSGSVRIRTSDGQTAVMSAADRKKWSEQRRTTIAAHEALRKQLASTGDENKAVAAVVKQYRIPSSVARALLAAAKKQPVKGTQLSALKAYFKGGVVPPGYITGKVS